MPAEIPVYVTRMDDLAEYENDRLDHPKLYEVYGRECGFYQEEGLYVKLTITTPNNSTAVKMPAAVFFGIPLPPLFLPFFTF